MTKTALITGITGQDGAYLAQLLLSQGYRVVGVFRRVSTPNFWRLCALDVFDKVELMPADLMDQSSLMQAVRAGEPDEVYHLAAQSFVGSSFDQPIATAEITGLGVPRILEVIKQLNPRMKFYQASTSELFGNGNSRAQSEDTPFRPVSPYGAAKLFGYWVTRIYREAYGIFACNGILFNHESPLRGLEFVTRKITNSVARIALGLQEELRLGNLEAKRDWGYAPDYVESMWLMLQQDNADDYVVATNETHTVRDFVQKAFAVVGLDWEKHVRIDRRFIRPIDVNYLQGDYTKAKEELGWEPKVRLDQLVEIMVKEDINRWERVLRGEHFAWDATAHPDENRLVSVSCPERTETNRPPILARGPGFRYAKDGKDRGSE